MKTNYLIFLHYFVSNSFLLLHRFENIRVVHMTAVHFEGQKNFIEKEELQVRKKMRSRTQILVHTIDND